jgi:hypothetical protein
LSNCGLYKPLIEWSRWLEIIIITAIEMPEDKCSVVFKPSMESITYITEQLGGGGFIPFGWVADGINHKAFLPLKE